MTPAKKDRGCECCAVVVSKMPLKYRFINRMIRLPNRTENKNLPVLVCPVCDEPLLANARKRAGKNIGDE